MASYSSDRRSLLKIFGAVGATCAYPFASDELFGQTAEQHHHESSPQQPDSQPQFFNKADFATISRVVDLIIPATDTPGALAAGVPAYVDLVIARNTDQQLVMADGLRWLDGEAARIGAKKFVELTEKQQLSMLEPLCELADSTTGLARGRNVQFFALVKNLTADGFYTSPQGLRQELGYKGNSAMAEYPSCVPEH
ncbi:MAG: gluconate 2-dehydrogenase subunit 3 family protein [Bryobacteraceae bacterium]